MATEVRHLVHDELLSNCWLDSGVPAKGMAFPRIDVPFRRVAVSYGTRRAACVARMFARERKGYAAYTAWSTGGGLAQQRVQ
jgi:hypothetical protein